MITKDINKLVEQRVAALMMVGATEAQIRKLYEKEVERLVDKHQVAVSASACQRRHWDIHHSLKGKHTIAKALRRLDEVRMHMEIDINIGTKWEPEAK